MLDRESTMGMFDMPSGYPPDDPSALRRTLHGLRHAASVLSESKIALAGAVIVMFWILAALLAPLAAPFDPNEIDYDALGQHLPDQNHWLGTDKLGRDLLSRIMWGARVVLTVAPLAVLSAYLAGIALGAVAGYYGGWVDLVISRISDIILSFPVLVLYIIMMVALGPSALNIVFAVTISSSPSIGRIIRGLILELKTQEYRMAAQMRGESSLYIILVELLPNARGPLITDACLRMGWVIISIGVLGFLGLGLPPPDPDWGSMIKDGSQVMITWPHIALVPAVAISSLVVGFNLFADGIREILQRD